MQKLLKNAALFTLVCSLLILGRCSFLDWNINGELSTTMEVREAREDVNIHYSSTSMLSADSDDDIKDNLNKIKDWNVNELSYAVRNFEGDPSITFSGEIGFSKIDASSASITASVSDLILSEISDNGKKYVINLSESQFNTMSMWLDEDHGISIYIEGVFSEGPAAFDLKVNIDISVNVQGF